MIEGLQVIDGYIQGERFIMRDILGHAVYGRYKADGLRSMARLINNESFNMTIDEDKQIKIPEDEAIIMQKELNKIADYLEGNT